MSHLRIFSDPTSFRARGEKLGISVPHICLPSGNKVGRITPQGHITEFLIPTPNSITTEITRGSDGNLWFFENGGNKIGRITPQGRITEFLAPAGSDLV